MEFPRSYFEDEVRDGFYVHSLMKRAWAAQLEVLEDIDKVCKKHNIEYFAEWGTLLGAIRHGGFVPWDDDMDICMKREDYNKFLKVAPEEMKEYYHFLNFENSDDGEFKCDDYLTRLYTGHRVRLDQAYMQKFHGLPYVVGMDIFPLDYMPPTEKEDELMCEELRVLSTLAQAINGMERHEKREYIRKIENMYKIKFDKNKSLRIQLLMLSDELGSRCKEEDATYITAMALHTLTGYKVPKEYYAEAIWVPFENTQIPVPVGYDGVLKIKYGDYMKPVRDGGAHEYPFYKRQQVVYEEKREPLFKTYQYDEKNLHREGEGMEQGQTFKEIASNMINLFAQAHQSMVDCMEAGDFEPVLTLLEDCQDGAIAFGTKIEEVKGEGHATVHILEKYCEVLYTIHEAILGNVEMDVQTAIDLLDENLTAMDESVKKEILSKKTAVFLPYKASMWDSLESVWKAADADPDCDAYVVPIPYYDRNEYCAMDKMHYEGDQYPDYVPVVDYQTIDLESMHPDMIFIHNPYDEFNIATSVHPMFYSKVLKNYTDNLVYIPYFVLDEIKPTDERAVKSMEHFVTTAGVMHADTVIVQSEDMRQTYIEALVKFAGEDTRSVWEKKILGLGSPKYDKVLSDASNVQVPEEWKKVLYKENGDKKKVILYNTGLGALLEHNEAMLDKIESVLKMFQEKQEDLTLLWRPHPLIKATIQSMRPKLFERYEKIVEDYCAAGFGIYDDTADLDRAIKISDAYYGDPSSVIQLCKKVGMPAMVQNVDIL